jgi:uncharacterized protein (TIGR02599 family)
MNALKQPAVVRSGFTIIELLVSMAVLTLLSMMLVSITNVTQRTWIYSSSKTEQFRAARDAFESITRKLSQATLNTYWDYHYPAGATSTTPPDSYMRQSELRFVSGNLNTIANEGTYPSCPTHAVFFQAPLGYTSDNTSLSDLQLLLNTWGYFVEFGSDSLWRPSFVNELASPPAERYRFRLMELMEPSEQLTLYAYTSGTDSNGLPKTSSYTGTQWFTTPLLSANRPARVVAENILALIILPKLATQEDATGAQLAPQYTYDTSKIGAAASLAATAAAAVNSKNQLPPVIQVTMVAVDDASFSRFLGSSKAIPSSLLMDGNTPLFQSVGDISNADQNGYARDMKTLQSNLQSHRINYRVFSTDISLKGAKWSCIQSN